MNNHPIALKWANTSTTMRPRVVAKTDKGSWMVQPASFGDKKHWELYHATNHYQFTRLIDTEEDAKKVAQFAERYVIKQD